MESNQYENHLLQCHENTLYSAGWMLCPYIFNRKCTLGRGIFSTDSKKGGTNRFGVHMQTHEKSTVLTEAVQELDVKCGNETSRVSAVAVMLDLRPKSFDEAHEGIALFAEATLKAGQIIPYAVTINR